MFCCEELGQAHDEQMMVHAPITQLRDGRVLNEIDSEYFLRGDSSSGRAKYLAVNYCPFCGRAISRGLWNQEKKK